MPKLLESAIEAHGGLANWKQIGSIDLLCNFSGGLLQLKGFPEHLRPILTVSTLEPRKVFQRLGGALYELDELIRLYQLDRGGESWRMQRL